MVPKAAFKVSDMHQFIVDSDMRTKVAKVEALMGEEPETFSLRKVYFMSRQEKMEHALAIGKRLIELLKEGKLSGDDISIADMVLDINGPFGLHRAMFIPTLQNQATVEQQEL
ncbi:hypothetical protein GGI06_005141, partial [Coemansia sp. S85]